MTSELTKNSNLETQKERLQDALYFALSNYSGFWMSWEDGAELTRNEIKECWESALLNFEKTLISDTGDR